MADTKRKRRKTANKAARIPVSRPGADARTIAIGVAAGLGAVAAIVAGVLGLRRATGGGADSPAMGVRAANRTGGSGAEHPAPDLAADAPPVGSERAPEAFRPDPTAPVPASERESLRPATGPAPSLASTRGEMANQTGAANG